MTKVKICGLSTYEATIAADEADYAGFVVGSPKSHRNISLAKFKGLRKELTHAKPVLVTVNSNLKFLHEIHQFEDVIIQLHGNARNFASMINRSAIGLNLNEYTERSYFQEHTYDFLSIDSTQKDGYGGTGKIWDWKNMKRTNQERYQTVLIAGGIGFENVSKALSETNADGVDVSSSMEINKEKSPERISDFITLVRGLK